MTSATPAVELRLHPSGTLAFRHVWARPLAARQCRVPAMHSGCRQWHPPAVQVFEFRKEGRIVEHCRSAFNLLCCLRPGCGIQKAPRPFRGTRRLFMRSRFHPRCPVRSARGHFGACNGAGPGPLLSPLQRSNSRVVIGAIACCGFQPGPRLSARHLCSNRIPIDVWGAAFVGDTLDLNQ